MLTDMKKAALLAACPPCLRETNPDCRCCGSRRIMSRNHDGCNSAVLAGAGIDELSGTIVCPTRRPLRRPCASLAKRSMAWPCR